MRSMDEMEVWQALLRNMTVWNASDLHAAPCQHVQIRRDGNLMAENFVPSGAFMEQCAECMLSAEQRALLRAGDVDFAWGWEKRRFRGNFYRTHDGLSLALRLLPERIMTPDEIGMPSALRTSLDAHDGLVLLCGATGAGKTTTLAALIDAINHVRSAHIITLEDPVEYIFAPDRSFFSQRELGHDFASFPNAVRSALREDPDLLLVGEIRDRATMEAALLAATTGILVVGTLHASSAAQAARRVESLFPADVRDAVRAQFADAMQRGIFVQRLLPRRGGGRVAAFEVLSATPAVRNILRQGRYEQLTALMMSGSAQGMQTMEAAEELLRRRGILA